MNRNRIAALFALAGLLPLAGCLPTVDPNKATAPAPPAKADVSIPVDPAKATPDTPVAPAPTPPTAPANPPAEDPKDNTRIYPMPGEGKPGANTAVIRVESAPDGSFIVNGGEALQGSIKPDPAGGWVLDGTIKFPAHGYTVDKPFTASLDNVKDGSNEISKGTTMFTVALPFKYPPKGTTLDMVPESIPIHHKFDAPASTQFVVTLVPSL